MLPSTASLPALTPAPVDIPPPPPGADPREPETVAYRTSRTPQRARSPLSSRASSPSRDTGSPPLLAPNPRSTSTSGSLPKAGSPPSRLFHPTAVGHAQAHGANQGPVSLQAGHHALGTHLSRPSSPSSIHSSGSAIFERDIEPAPPALSLNSSTTLSHKSSRIFHPHGSTLEHTVPAVLDDAVEALTASEPDQGLSGLEIEAPTSCSGRNTSASMSPGLRSRVTSMHARAPNSASRSPSPETKIAGSPSSPSAPPLSLGALSTHAASNPSDDLSPSSPKRQPTAPQLPGGWAFSDDDAKENTSGNATPVPAPALPSHLTPTKDKRRISFISYNDLLLSVPTTVTSLNEITSGNLSPDHLPGTISPNVPTRSPVMTASTSPTTNHHVEPPSAPPHAQAEWSREGLGKGLEQRLEDLILDPKAAA